MRSPGSKWKYRRRSRTKPGETQHLDGKMKKNQQKWLRKSNPESRKKTGRMQCHESWAQTVFSGAENHQLCQMIGCISPSRTSCYNQDIPIYQWHRQYKFLSNAPKVYSSAESKDKRWIKAFLCSMMIIRAPCWQRLSHFQLVTFKVTQGVIVLQ